MKAIEIYHAGGPEQLKMIDKPVPRIKPGWTLIKIKAFGLNHAEIYTRQGQSYPDVKFPRVIGIEAVGEIFKTNNSDFQVGQRIMTLMGNFGRHFDGSYEEYALVPDSQIYPLNLDRSWEELAAIPETGYTAIGAIKASKVSEKSSVLVRGATSTVGTAATMIMKTIGAKVTATTRKPEHVQFLKDVGADTVIIDKDGKLQTSRKFDAIIDFVGIKVLYDTLSHLNPGGIQTIVGGLGEDKWTVDNFDPFAIPSGSYLTNFSSDPVNKDWLNELIEIIKQNDIHFPIAHTFKLDEIVQAHQLMESGKAVGKMIVTE